MNILDTIRCSESSYEEEVAVEAFFFLIGEEVTSVEALNINDPDRADEIYTTCQDNYSFFEDIIPAINDLQFILSCVDNLTNMSITPDTSRGWCAGVGTVDSSSTAYHEDPQLALLDAVCQIVLKQRLGQPSPPSNDNLKRRYLRLIPK